MKDASGSVICRKSQESEESPESYFSQNPSGNTKVLAMISHIADFDYIVVESELEALLLEANLIKLPTALQYPPA